MFQLNPEQQSAVENIFYAKPGLPYILVGPPGKLEIFIKICHIQEKKNILKIALFPFKVLEKHVLWLHPLNKLFS